MKILRISAFNHLQKYVVQIIICTEIKKSLGKTFRNKMQNTEYRPEGFFREITSHHYLRSLRQRRFHEEFCSSFCPKCSIWVCFPYHPEGSLNLQNNE